MRKLDTGNVSNVGQWIISTSQNRLLLMVLIYDAQTLRNELHEFENGRWLQKIDLPSFLNSRPCSFQCRGADLNTLIIGCQSKVVYYMWSHSSGEYSQVWERSTGPKNVNVLTIGDKLIFQATNARNWQITNIRESQPQHWEYPGYETQPLVAVSEDKILAHRGSIYYLMQLQ